MEKTALKLSLQILQVVIGFGPHISNDWRQVTATLQGGMVTFEIMGYELAQVSYKAYSDTVADIQDYNHEVASN
jgi:hypothetical protein